MKLVLLSDRIAAELNILRFVKYSAAKRLFDRRVGLYDTRRVKRARRRAPPKFLRNVFAGYLVRQMVTG